MLIRNCIFSASGKGVPAKVPAKVPGYFFGNFE
jgi:hypothetical protein